MRLLLPVIFLCCLLVVGCSQPRSAPQSAPRRESVVLLLDNNGGVGHSGRRIALLPDGGYTETIYSDVIGDEHTTKGRYALNPERTDLILSPESRAAEHLYRVDSRGKQYWIHDSERERITRLTESWLRELSLRVAP
jgi:hypothetical protein